jgi:hypothetical protein
VGKLNKIAVFSLASVLIVFVAVFFAVMYAPNYGGQIGTNTVKYASTLTFNANITAQGTTLEQRWAARDIKHENKTFRVEILDHGSEKFYVLNAGQQKSWSSTDGVTWVSSDFAADWATFNPEWEDYFANLINWRGSGNYSITNSAEQDVLLFDISVNPAIPDSTFAVG